MHGLTLGGCHLLAIEGECAAHPMKPARASEAAAEIGILVACTERHGELAPLVWS
jgi:hypothetical protein